MKGTEHEVYIFMNPDYVQEVKVRISLKLVMWLALFSNIHVVSGAFYIQICLIKITDSTGIYAKKKIFLIVPN